MSTKEEVKAELERRQFGYFLNQIPCEHKCEEIESRCKPEPDILFRKSIAFELTEICPPEVAHLNSILPKVGGVKLVYPANTAAERISEKLTIPYVSSFPLELLCFRTSRTLWHDEVVLSELRTALASHAKIQFQRIWYCGEKVEIIYNPSNLPLL